MRRAARIDSNHNEIVAALRDVGATVTSLAAVGCGVPDVLVGFRFKNFLLEIKGPTGKLDEFQKVYHRVWKGQIAVVRTPEEALKAIGAILGGSGKVDAEENEGDERHQPHREKKRKAKKRSVTVWLLAWQYPHEAPNATAAFPFSYARNIAAMIKRNGGTVGPIVKIEVPL